jgi:allantoicase
MSELADSARTDVSGLTDLVSRDLGGCVMLANDDLFADRRHLIDPRPPVWQPDTYGRDGKIYDGWETRRRRNQATPTAAPDESEHDYAIVRLGAPGLIRTLIVDTAFFRGNYPSHASVEALAVEGYPTVEELEAMPWTTLLPRSSLKGDTANTFEIADNRRWTHLRLTIYPDGGVSRFRALGVGLPDPRLLSGTFDLVCLRNGGRVVAVSDMFYSSAANLILPGSASNISEGWETARRRDGGHDWVLFSLAGAARLRVAEVDSSHFTGNAPGAARLVGIDARSVPLEEAMADESRWVELVPRTRLLPDTNHRFRLREVWPDGPPPVTHVRLDVYPDGGLSRVRIWGEFEPEAAVAQARGWLAALPADQARDVLAHVPGSDPNTMEGALLRYLTGLEVS